MTWNVVHNFPGAKDTYQVPVDYPTVGYDTIIAAWFTDIFTSILAMQDSLLDLVGKVLLLVGGTMTGLLTLDNTGGDEEEVVLQFKDFEGNNTLQINDLGAFNTLTDYLFAIGGVAMLSVGEEEASITPKLYATNDIEITTVGKGPIIKSPNTTKYRIKVDNAGVLSTEVV